MGTDEVKQSEVEKLYGQLGISPKSNDFEEYPFSILKRIGIWLGNH